jgi:hypothetical protein
MVITIFGVDRCSPVVADDNRGLFLKSRHLMADEQIRCSVGFYVSKHGNNDIWGGSLFTGRRGRQPRIICVKVAIEWRMSKFVV